MVHIWLWWQKWQFSPENKSKKTHLRSGRRTPRTRDGHFVGFLSGTNAWVHGRFQICGIWGCFLWWCTVTGEVMRWVRYDSNTFMNPTNGRLEDILNLQEPMAWNKHVESEVSTLSIPQQEGYSLQYKTYQNILNCMQRLCDATCTQFCPRVLIFSCFYLGWNTPKRDESIRVQPKRSEVNFPFNAIPIASGLSTNILIYWARSLL